MIRICKKNMIYKCEMTGLSVRDYPTLKLLRG